MTSTRNNNDEVSRHFSALPRVFASFPCCKTSAICGCAGARPRNKCVSQWCNSFFSSPTLSRSLFSAEGAKPRVQRVRRLKEEKDWWRIKFHLGEPQQQQQKITENININVAKAVNGKEKYKNTRKIRHQGWIWISKVEHLETWYRRAAVGPHKTREFNSNV